MGNVGTAIQRALVRCAVGDSHPVMLDSVASALSDAGFAVVSTASTSAQTLRAISALAPDVAVLDAAMLAMTGEELGQACLATRVVIFTGSDGENVLREGVEPGALAYVSKSQPLEVLVDIVDIVASGGSWVDPAVAPILIAHGARSEMLTRRESEVLERVSNGASYQEIADELGIAVPTVQQHVTSAMAHLAAGTRTQAVAAALRLLLFE